MQTLIKDSKSMQLEEARERQDYRFAVNDSLSIPPPPIHNFAEFTCNGPPPPPPSAPMVSAPMPVQSAFCSYALSCSVLFCTVSSCIYSVESPESAIFPP